MGWDDSIVEARREAQVVCARGDRACSGGRQLASLLHAIVRCFGECSMGAAAGCRSIWEDADEDGDTRRRSRARDAARAMGAEEGRGCTERRAGCGAASKDMTLVYDDLCWNTSLTCSRPLARLL